MKKVRWGLLSTARINRRVIPAIRISKRAKLAAVASRDQTKSGAYAKEWEIPIAYGSYEEMLASSEVDAIYISLPNHLHAEWAIKALQAGKHVLCEKPFALTTADVDRMVAAKEASGLALAEAFMWRHHPQALTLEEWLRAGRLGEVTQVNSYFSFEMSSPQGNVRMVPGFGGGSLWDVGIYPVSFAQLVMQSAPEWAAASQRLGPTGVDEDFTGMMAYPGGRAAHIGSSFRVPYTTYGQVVGTEGRLVMTRPFNATPSPDREMVFFPRQGRPLKIKTGNPELYLGEIDDMNEAILDGTPNRITLAESRLHVQAAQALHQAASTGQSVRLDSIG